MAVNTPSGLTERQPIKNSVLQGDTWGSLLASVQVDTIGQECEESGYGYLYKDSLEVSLLGLVDDMIGVTEAGYKAQQMNALINIKSADKGLQFGITKCKSMLVGKDLDNVPNSNLTVDSWKVSHIDIPGIGGDELVENYEGQVPIEKTEEQKYLGFVLSSKGNNMVNINHMKMKSKGIIRTMFSKLNSLNLQKYYFECGIVFLNSMLRSSILYACETYYDLKEAEVRQLERIEEGFLRELLKTSKGCPITQLYLEAGLIPARYEIIKTRLLFLKNILNQKRDSMISKFFDIQLKTSSKGDWAYMCLQNLKELEIENTIDEIRDMPLSKFKNLVRRQVKKAALKYLTGKQRSKGGDMVYTKLQMAEYLLPSRTELSIETKQKIFEVRNKMVKIPANFSSNHKKDHSCKCGMKEDMKHIYICPILNNEEQTTEYENIYSNNVPLIKEVYTRFEKNMRNREIIQSENDEELKANNKDVSHVILSCDPLYSVIDYSNG